MTAQGQPWMKQPKESEPAYAAFCAFRDAGPGRTVAAVGRALGKSGNLMDRWCQRNQWRERAAAWDAAQVSVLQQSTAEVQRETLAAHLEAAAELLAMARRLLTPPDVDHKTGATLTDDAKAAWRPGAAAVQAAAIAQDKAITAQRMALGLPTSHSQQDVLLRQEMAEAREVNRTLIRVLEEHLCDECRPHVLDELERITRQYLAIGGAGTSTAPAAP